MTLLSLMLAYIPHGHCYLWQTGLVGLHITADLLIALSYFSIPIALVYFARKRQDLPFKEVFTLFGAFIICCGATHLMAIWTLWHPDYWQSGILKAITAFVSVTTAVILVPIVPKALSLPSPAELETANTALAQKIQEHQAAEIKLQEQNQKLAAALQQLRQAQAIIIQNEKMSSLGQLVAGITHELNNPISFIYGNLFHLQFYFSKLFRLLDACRTCLSDQRVAAVANEIELDFIVKDSPKLLASMQVGTDRICKIVTSLSAFSRLEESGLKPIDLGEALDNTLTVLGSRLRSNNQRSDISVIKHYCLVPKVECYPRNLDQVLLNLLTNAIDAIEAQALLQNSDSDLLYSGLIEITVHAPTPSLVRIEIYDNGAGIPPHLQSRIFDPFFTTKPVGQGTGMGLAISYQVIKERHSGSLTCRSETGKGTTFVVELPVCQTQPQATESIEDIETVLIQSLGLEMPLSV